MSQAALAHLPDPPRSCLGALHHLQPAHTPEHKARMGGGGGGALRRSLTWGKLEAGQVERGKVLRQMVKVGVHRCPTLLPAHHPLPLLARAEGKAGGRASQRGPPIQPFLGRASLPGRRRELQASAPLPCSGKTPPPGHTGGPRSLSPSPRCARDSGVKRVASLLHSPSGHKGLQGPPPTPTPPQAPPCPGLHLQTPKEHTRLA